MSLRQNITDLVITLCMFVAYEVQVGDILGIDFAPDLWTLDGVRKVPNAWFRNDEM